MDWSSLQSQSTAYINRVLDNTDGDLLFRVNLYSGETGYLYYAHEHQSTNDALMAFPGME
ncbi:Rpn family recombination-promoting nuclease/putative transposase [Nocardia camponoti]|uniref:Rpn family recombination-promoting nuclease/putative transposase n=1 Tax=Nocardia camponoti TaxID=1616106 RepID=UPI001662C189